MARQYLTEFREDMLGRTLAGESLVVLYSDLGVPEQTLDHWQAGISLILVLSMGTSQLRAASCASHTYGLELLRRRA